MNRNKVIMKATGLCKSFANNGGQNHVLNMIDLEIYDGDFTVIMGSSGAGKSTLLYALSGMDKPTGGEVRYKDAVISSLKEKKMAPYRIREFGFVFQQAHLVSNLTLFENVAVTGYLDRQIAVAGIGRRGAAGGYCKSHDEYARHDLCRRTDRGAEQKEHAGSAGYFDADQ